MTDDEAMGRENADDSIYALYAEVRHHPDFAGGTIFTRDDVLRLSSTRSRTKATARRPIHPRRDEATSEQLGAVTGFFTSLLFDFVFAVTDWREEIMTWLGGEPPPA